MRGWLSISHSIFRSHGGTGLLQKYRGSLPTLLLSVYPEYKTMCREAILHVMKELKMEKVETLTSVSASVLYQFDPHLIQQYNHNPAKSTHTSQSNLCSDCNEFS